MIYGGTNFGFWNGAETNAPVRIFILEFSDWALHPSISHFLTSTNGEKYCAKLRNSVRSFESISIDQRCSRLTIDVGVNKGTIASNLILLAITGDNLLRLLCADLREWRFHPCLHENTQLDQEHSRMEE